MEKVIEQTSEGHVDYNTLGQALEGIQDMKDVRPPLIINSYSWD